MTSSPSPVGDIPVGDTPGDDPTAPGSGDDAGAGAVVDPAPAVDDQGGASAVDAPVEAAPVGGVVPVDGTAPLGEPGVVAPAAPDADSPREGGKVSGLEEEGEVAADYLEEFLDIIDIDGDIDLDVADARAVVSVVGDDDAGSGPLRVLAGPRGEVLEALQELTRLAVQTRTGERSRLMLDVAGYRAERREQLLVVAREAIAAVEADGEAVALDPMNPFERKVVHDAVAEAGLVSDSDGVEPARRVVVHPRQDQGA